MLVWLTWVWVPPAELEEDRILPHNPCRIRGAGSERVSERPVLAVAQVFESASWSAATRSVMSASSHAAAITNAIDIHVQAEQRSDDDDNDGLASVHAPMG